MSPKHWSGVYRTPCRRNNSFTSEAPTLIDLLTVEDADMVLAIRDFTVLGNVLFQVGSSQRVAPFSASPLCAEPALSEEHPAAK
jgi:hypothetical protein